MVIHNKLYWDFVKNPVEEQLLDNTAYDQLLLQSNQTSAYPECVQNMVKNALYLAKFYLDIIDTTIKESESKNIGENQLKSPEEDK